MPISRPATKNARPQATAPSPGGSADDSSDNNDANTPIIASIGDNIGEVLQTGLGIGSAEAAEVPPATNNVLASWGNPSILQSHFDKHGHDFGATSPQDYADQANQFYQRYQNEGLSHGDDDDQCMPCMWLSPFGRACV